MMNGKPSKIQQEILAKCGLTVSEYAVEPESREYAACRFTVSGARVVSRKSKITPKKIGQFVTFWKRNDNGNIAPLHINDAFDLYVITATAGDKIGQFVFPKSFLAAAGMISTDRKEGKRGFRVYPSWDEPESKQAVKTQARQLDYFYTLNSETDFGRVRKLYGAEDI